MAVYKTDANKKLVKTAGNIAPLSAETVAFNTVRTRQNDTVVEYYVSSDTNLWYRKWASGWIEQGGKLVANVEGRRLVTFPLPFSNRKYTILKTLNWHSSEAVINRAFFGFQEMTEQTAYTSSYATANGDYSECWYACGF